MPHSLGWQPREHVPTLQAPRPAGCSTFSKLRSTRAVHPLIFNYWLAEGVALSGLLLLALPPRVSEQTPCWVCMH